ncbi:hypothetical protein Scep_018942 [Stephania cephalantha]|uniref:Uncharacterized protein n=1 Tax=Stephania cephalantha TaxID=152367 RepID=A0AAP0IAA7_9MAGN
MFNPPFSLSRDRFLSLFVSLSRTAQPATHFDLSPRRNLSPKPINRLHRLSSSPRVVTASAKGGVVCLAPPPAAADRCCIARIRHRRLHRLFRCCSARIRWSRLFVAASETLAVVAHLARCCAEPSPLVAALRSWIGNHRRAPFGRRVHRRSPCSPPPSPCSSPIDRHWPDPSAAAPLSAPPCAALLSPRCETLARLVGPIYCYYCLSLRADRHSSSLLGNHRAPWPVAVFVLDRRVRRCSSSLLNHCQVRTLLELEEDLEGVEREFGVAESGYRRSSGGDVWSRPRLHRTKVDNEVVYLNVAGECPKGRVYGLGSLGRKKMRYARSGASTSQMPEMVPRSSSIVLPSNYDSCGVYARGNLG